MNTLKSIAVIGLIATFPLCAGAETTTVKNQTVSTAQPTKDMPVYKPPLRGAPAGRIGGATRGTTERESFSLLVLAPDHVGYTTKEQPCLYWYISKPTTYSVVLTVTERNAVKPLVEKILKGPEKVGIQSVCLADYGVRLRPNVQYKWFVALVPDAEHRSKDIMAGGILSLVDPQPSLLAKLKTVDSSNAHYIYAEEGFWYDALEAITRMIDASPDNADLHKQRASLLEQVGLAEAADFENRQ
jgi:hypothetical protein